MTSKKILFSFLSLLIFICINVNAQQKVVLERSSPEKEGVASTGIIQFFDAAAKSKTEFHSFMLLRHG